MSASCSRTSAPLRTTPPTCRFSSTVIFLKILRPSGTSAMPARAARCAAWPDRSRPSSRMRPADGFTSPMIALMVVLLPAPLEPSSAMIWPFSTARFTPCSTSISPEAAHRFSTTSVIGASADELVHAEIGADHFGLALRRRGGTGEDVMPLVDDGYAMAKPSDQFEIVLDEHLRAALRRNVLYQRSETLAFALGQTGRGLIQQQEFRLRDDGAGDFDKVALAERQRFYDSACDVIEPDPLQRAIHGLPNIWRRQRPKYRGPSARMREPMTRQPGRDVFVDRQLTRKPHLLERARDAASRPPVRR